MPWVIIFWILLAHLPPAACLVPRWRNPQETFFTEQDIDAMFSLFDPTGRGHVSQEQYQRGAVRAYRYGHAPPASTGTTSDGIFERKPLTGFRRACERQKHRIVVKNNQNSHPKVLARRSTGIRQVLG